MKLFKKDLKKEILYIAEIGVNHEGNFNKCLKLIKKAKKAGADVVKFQCFTPDKYYSIEETKFEQAKKYAFNQNQFKNIISFCKKIKINYLFTALTEDWVNFVNKYSKTIKVASGDLNFHTLIKKILKKNLNIILSTGISDEKEISKTVNLIRGKYKDKMKSKLIILHCVSNYPVEEKNVNLINISYLKEKYNLNVGYSNHAIGIDSCLAAICLGANVLEFHFTDNKKRKFRDHQLSFDEKDLTNLIAKGNKFKILLGKMDRTKLPKNLISLKKNFNKGLIAKKKIKPNEYINKSYIGFARTAKYTNANDINHFHNKKSKVNINKGEYLKRSYFH